MTDKEVMQQALGVLEEGYKAHTPKLKRTIAALRQAIAQPVEPVMYQERSDLSGPYSSFQGWTDWHECNKSQYDIIRSNSAFYATAQVRVLVVAVNNPIAPPVQPKETK